MNTKVYEETEMKYCFSVVMLDTLLSDGMINNFEYDDIRIRLFGHSICTGLNQ